MIDTSYNYIITERPLQVKKLSQLPDYLSYYNNKEYGITLENSYLFISYPSNNNNIPHNYKLSLFRLTELFMITVNEKIAKLQVTLNKFKNKLEAYRITLESIKSCECEEQKEELSYYWNLTAEEVEDFQKNIAPWCPDTETIEKITNEWLDANEDYNNLIKQ